MRAITIQQPYASLICNPPWVKRVENRVWGTRYRGPLAIHAGKGKNWLHTLPSEDWPNPMPFGAVLGIVDLVDCILFEEREAWAAVCPDREWILDHLHASGPFCWILENPRLLPEPIPASGMQGFWEWNGAAGIGDGEEGSGFRGQDSGTAEEKKNASGLLFPNSHR